MLNKPNSTIAILIFMASLLVAEPMLGQDKQGAISITGNEVRIEGVSIQSKVEDEQSGATIDRKIRVGNVVNISNGGNSIIQIGSIDGTRQSACENDHDPANDSSVVSIIGDNRSIDINQPVRFDLCVKGSENKVHVLADNRIDVLKVDGTQNEIRISSGAYLKDLIISGERNRVYVPRGSEVNTVSKGVGNVVIKY